MHIRGLVAAACKSPPGFPTPTSKSKEAALRITCKGQVTIPIEIRRQTGLLPQTEVEFEFDGKVVRISRRQVVPRASAAERDKAFFTSRRSCGPRRLSADDA
jgi:bifunctional DNA-binding transcriptional regulator/antitoxin component of YhaV-PrlF toxin-antitoxin module